MSLDEKWNQMFSDFFFVTDTFLKHFSSPKLQSMNSFEFSDTNNNNKKDNE